MPMSTKRFFMSSVSIETYHSHHNLYISSGPPSQCASVRMSYTTILARPASCLCLGRTPVGIVPTHEYEHVCTRICPALSELRYQYPHPKTVSASGCVLLPAIPYTARITAGYVLHPQSSSIVQHPSNLPLFTHLVGALFILLCAFC